MSLKKKKNHFWQQLHTFSQRLSDAKLTVAIFLVVGTTIFNFGSALFNYALITKLKPINEKVSAIEHAGKERDDTFSEFKTAYDRQYGGLIDKIDSVANKIDRLTLKLVGVKF